MKVSNYPLSSSKRLKIFLLAFITTLSFIKVVEAGRYKNFTSQYSAEWDTIDDSGTLRLKITLRMKDLDITSWRTQGDNGLWMGIGFGSTQMAGSDLALCTIAYTNSSQDSFVCEDRYSEARGQTILDQSRQIVDLPNGVGSTAEFDPIQNKYFYTTEATFKRNFVNTDPNPDEDKQLIFDSNVDIIWAYGQMSSGTANYHSQRGIDKIYLSSNSMILKTLTYTGLIFLSAILYFQ
ncbi:UNKNOWN [Stylonychia lemnae]|uniref:DOMON domain-containing protein n=1 Tax=Stylonychia lemnae TaxID=5949 RepID=A0A078AW25_STYLE|nr:UNKNOWN [Stylonychia lemnae]|eukprot:CDW84983.1 UNKNOWN [Stylonychia lemnae]